MSIRLRLLAALFACNALVAADDASCLKCHTNRAELTKSLKGKSAKSPLEKLLVDEKRYKRSVHASRGCAECHFDYDSFPHSGEAETAKCAECHEDQAKAYAPSAHGQATQGDDRKLPVDCASCHGLHDVYKPGARDSTLHPLNVHKTCGKCHFEKTGYADLETAIREKYLGDVHGHGIVKAGLVVSATCVSCHGGHDIHRKDDPKSALARRRVHLVCGKCHLGAQEDYEKSAHRFRERENGEFDGAACTDCHLPHHIVRAERFRAESIEQCGKCHEERLGTFRNTFHGKVSELGFEKHAANCADCHGSHGILPSSDEDSLMSTGNRIETCGKCHNNANENFVSYLVHADTSDSENYPGLYKTEKLMTGLLTGTFFLAGLHALLWLLRSLAAGEWRGSFASSGVWVRRWSNFYTALHVLMMTSFVTVAATGLPLHFSHRPWAKGAMDFLGGPGISTFLHRIAAIVMICTILAYLFHLCYRAFIKREKGLWTGPTTMIPRYQDWKDFIGMYKWFFGMGPKPKFDRWTYWEKFDFWSVFWGIVIIGASGMILWFPVAATRILPGWAINVAHIIHGHEALLAIGFIFSIHIFHTQFRPEKFPMDIFFYTGRMTEAEFKHEKPLEYERAVQQGTLEAMREARPRRRTRRRGYILGTVALIIWISCVVAMVAALVS